jgi:predicted DNA-binding ribbon-helix-helix protein
MIHIGRHRTSIRLDEPTRRALLDIAAREGFTVNELCTAVAAEKPRAVTAKSSEKLATCAAPPRIVVRAA